ncbi:MAG: nucleotidyltransferase domain-containing protein [Endomicrobium sp.]|jgi:predicted nucleotidyltransferase|nr:nucleotidyltransferase domain-containing protein [Endomicrobium sp.]
MRLGKITIKDRVFNSIIKKYGIKSLSVFGSSLRNDFNKDSDIDLLIEFKKPKEKSLFDLIDLRLELEEITGRKIDIVEKGSVKNPYKRKEINSTARLVYAD